MIMIIMRKMLSGFIIAGAAIFILSCDNVQMVDVPYGSPSPTSADLTINEDNFAGADAIYVKVKAYSSVGVVEGFGESVSDQSTEQTATLTACVPSCTVQVTWDANTEPGVNRAGGGYRVYFSDAQNFKIK
ncbi:MAG: hypothetical protein A2176_10540 [Spirochaetes bacterium RBG_13_51_14]|nr:MAG: hypothetical protein A2176_10540 [Spirochaetes bacterium RBG_13_51_14]